MNKEHLQEILQQPYIKLAIYGCLLVLLIGFSFMAGEYYVCNASGGFMEGNLLSGKCAQIEVVQACEDVIKDKRYILPENWTVKNL